MKLTPGGKIDEFEKSTFWDLSQSKFSKLIVFLSTFLDTFASKVAAIQDDCADASVGNVTGSNAVNVFLGIGIAWSMAAIYWSAQGEQFVVPVGR